MSVMNLLKSRCPNCHVRHFKAHSGCFGQDNCPFPVNEVPEIGLPHTTLHLTGRGPTIFMDAPEINGIPIKGVRKLTLTCDPKVSPLPLVVMELDVDLFDIEIPVEVQVIAHHYQRRSWVRRHWRSWHEGRIAEVQRRGCEHLNATFEREGESTRGSCPDCGDIAFSARWEEE